MKDVKNSLSRVCLGNDGNDCIWKRFSISRWLLMIMSSGRSARLPATPSSQQQQPLQQQLAQQFQYLPQLHHNFYQQQPLQPLQPPTLKSPSWSSPLHNYANITVTNAVVTASTLPESAYNNNNNNYNGNNNNNNNTIDQYSPPNYFGRDSASQLDKNHSGQKKFNVQHRLDEGIPAAVAEHLSASFKQHNNLMESSLQHNLNGGYNMNNSTLPPPRLM